MKDLPTVSIIVPVFNAENNIADLIESLLDLDYPRDLLEIIIVDNNSNDNTGEIIKRYPVVLLEETEIQSSYAARNRGIKYAKGEIIAFTDSDCIVTQKWIREGINTLISENADLAGGEIEFIFSYRKTTAEIYDSMVHMNNDNSIMYDKTAKTANLFVKHNLFNEIGMFPRNLKSGGDVYWTRRAVTYGFKLVYAHNAVVKHPARLLKDLLEKQYRTGTGKIFIWHGEGNILQGFIYWLLFKKLYTKKRLNIRAKDVGNAKVINIIFVKIACKLASILGICVGLFKNRKIKNSRKNEFM